MNYFNGRSTLRNTDIVRAFIEGKVLATSTVKSAGNVLVNKNKIVAYKKNGKIIVNDMQVSKAFSAIRNKVIEAVPERMLERRTLG